MKLLLAVISSVLIGCASTQRKVSEQQNFDSASLKLALAMTPEEVTEVVGPPVRTSSGAIRPAGGKAFMELVWYYEAGHKVHFTGINGKWYLGAWR